MNWKFWKKETKPLINYEELLKKYQKDMDRIIREEYGVNISDSKSVIFEYHDSAMYFYYKSNKNGNDGWIYQATLEEYILIS